MRRVSVFTVLLLVSSALLMGQNKRAMENADVQDYTFNVQEDGRVMVEGEIFNSMADFQQSDKFRFEGRRCKSALKQLENGGDRISNFKTAADCTNNETRIQSEYYITDTILIPTVFHILINTNGDGDIADSLIQSQIDIMNEDFGALSGTPGAPGYDTRIRFELAGITRHVDRAWYNDRKESSYKAATGWDRDAYMNIWTNTASGYLGYAYLPDGSAGSTVDGVVLNHTAVGRDAPNGGIYDQGRTATHEVGHYLGLQHTFDGGCGSDSAPYTSGDLIADTNAESSSQFDCIERDTCNSADPIHNYMDYTNDTCMDNFTQEQSNRMVCSLVNYRPSLGGGVVEPPSGDFTLAGAGYKVKGKHVVDLTWADATGSNIDIYRDGNLIATTANNGSYTDNIGTKGGATYVYEACEAGSSTCSNEATVIF